MNTRYSSYWIRLCVTFLSGTALLCAVLVDQTLATPPPIITSDTSLNGGGATVDGNGGSGLFVQSGNVVVSNATMTNFSTKGGDGSGGGAGMGGAIFVNSGASVTLNNVNFVANTVAGGKGGVGTVGGTLNDRFGSGPAADPGADGYTPTQTSYTDIAGTTGTKGYNAPNGTKGFGGTGGAGGAGGNGGDHSPSLFLATISAGVKLADKIIDAADAFANPFTINIGVSDVLETVTDAIDLANTIAQQVAFDKSLSDGQIGLGGSGGQGGQGGGGSDFFGGGKGGNGGNGGKGGANWSLSAFQGGAAGGDAGNGGSGGNGGFGAGGGQGGDGGIGGKGAPAAAFSAVDAVAAVTDFFTAPDTYKTYYIDPNTNQKVYLKYGLAVEPDPTTKSVYSNTAMGLVSVDVYSEVDVPSHQVEYTKTPASPAIAAGTTPARPDGLDGASGNGGVSAFGGGQGAQGASTGNTNPGGNGGSGFGGAIFVRNGGSLTITGDAVFDQNNAIGGDGQAGDSNTVQGFAGRGVGTDLFIMAGSTVTLAPGIGHTIVFNGSIADDTVSSALSYSSVSVGNGAGLTVQNGLVIFNGTNTYTGQTKISTDGVLQAVDGIGINANSNINLNGGILQSNGTITRFLGTDSNKLQWTADGGFSAQGGDLRVSLSNNSALTWGTTTGFVGGGNKLLFGSTSATGVVTFDNAINLGGSTRTILVTANLAIAATDTDSAYDANIDNVILNGVLSNGGLTVGDSTHTGVLILNKANTYTSGTTINGGTLRESPTGFLADTGILTVDGSTATFELGANHSDIVGTVTLDHGGTIAGSGNSTLTSTGSFEMKDGTVNAILAGTGIQLNKTTSGTVYLNNVNTYTGLTNITAGTLNLGIDNAINGGGNVVVNNGTLQMNSHKDTVGTVTLQNGGLIDGNGTLTSTGSFEMQDGTVNAVLAGTGIQLNKTTTGTVWLNNVNTYTGLTNITGGVLRIGVNNAIGGGGNVTVNSGSLDMYGKTDTVGTVTLQNGGLIYGSGTLTSTGSFELQDGTVGGTVLAGVGIQLNKTTSGTVYLNSVNTYTGLTNITAGTLQYGNSNAIASGNVTINGSTAVLDMAGYSDTVGTVTLDNSGTINGGSGSVLTSTADFVMKSGTANAVLAGAVGLNKTTSGTVTLDQQNTYTGLTNITAGTLLYGTNNAIGSGNVTIDGATTVLDMAGYSDTVGTVTLSNNATINGGSSSVLTSTGTFEMQSGTVNVVLGGSAALNKTTSGTVTLNNANTYTGATAVSAGKLILAGPAANLSTSTAVTISSGAELVVNGNNTVASVTVTNTGGTISGNNTLTAPTYNFNDGTLVTAKLGNVSTPGGSTITTNGGVTFSNTVAANTIEVQTGLLKITGADLLSHGATVTIDTAATLSLTGGNQTINTLNGNGALVLNGYNLNVTNNGTYTGTTTNVGSLTKTGGGTLSLSGNNTFNQGTTVDTGTVTVTGTGTLNTGNTTVTTGGTLQINTGGTVNTTGTTVNVGSTLVNNGTITNNVVNNGTVAGSGTFTGNVTANVGSTTSPGGSPGILTIAGNYTENGTLKIEIANASGPSLNNITGYDQVAVGGKTVLNPLTSVLTIGTPTYTPAEMLTPLYIANAAAIAAFQPTKGQTFTIINGASGSISGHFGTFTNNFTNDVIFNVSTGQLIGTGLLTATTGSNLLNAFTGASSNLQAMINGLKVGDHQYVGGDLLPLLLGAGTPALAATVANKASPEAYAGFTDYADRVTRNYTDDAVNLTPLVDTGKYSVFGGYANLDTGSSSSVNQADYTLKSSGAVTGARAAINSRLTVGLFAAFDSGSVDSTYLNSKVKGDVYGLFGEYTANADRSLTLTASLSTATYKADGTRVTATGVSSFHGVDSSANLAALALRYRILQRRTVTIQPELRLTYVSDKVDGFTETDALKPLQALNVHSQSNSSFTTEAAVNATVLAGAKLSFNGRLGVSHDFSDAARNVSANVVSETQSFTVKAPGMGDTAFNLGLGANYSLTSSWTVGVSCQASVASDAKASNSFYVSTALGF